MHRKGTVTNMFQACFQDDGKTEKSVLLILGNNGCYNGKGIIKPNSEGMSIILYQGFTTMTLVAFESDKSSLRRLFCALQDV